MKKLVEWILKFKSYLIPLIATALNFLPIPCFSEGMGAKIGLLIWTLIVGVLFYTIEHYPYIDISFNHNQVHSNENILLNFPTDSLENAKVENLKIKITPHHIPKYSFKKELIVTLPKGISIVGQTKIDNSYVNDNQIVIPLKDISHKGKHTLGYALALQADHISGEDSRIKCECPNSLVHCELSNKVTIHWE